MQKTYSQQEWDLVSKVMDTVDTLRKESTDPLDTIRVKALVMRTYAEQGIQVPEVLIDQALTTALNSFSPPTPTPDSLVDWMPWWQRLQTPASDEDQLTLVEKAQRSISALTHHKLLTQPEVDGLINQALDEATREQQQRTQRYGRRALVITFAAVLVLLLALRFLPVYLFVFPMWFCIMMPFMAWQKVSFSKKHLLSQPIQRAQTALVAAKKLKMDDHDLRSILGAMLGQLTTYNPEIMTEDRRWAWAETNADAMTDPVLARTWHAWLSSDKPIRQGDAALIHKAAADIRKAKEWMALQNYSLGPAQFLHRKQFLRQIEKHVPLD